ncbi:hypothetical protein D3C86_2032220 [compost metagenome]
MTILLVTGLIPSLLIAQQNLPAAGRLRADTGSQLPAERAVSNFYPQVMGPAWQLTERVERKRLCVPIHQRVQI